MNVMLSQTNVVNVNNFENSNRYRDFLSEYTQWHND